VENILKQVRAALEHEPRINLHRFPLTIERGDDGTLVLEGETENIAARKVAVELAASVPGVARIVDRLRVIPAQRMGDGQIRDHVRDALLGELAFESYAIRVHSDGQETPVNEPGAGSGYSITIALNEGVVTLYGRVSSVSHKAVAGAHAWWVPGSRDVINALEITPPQEPSDDEITEAVVAVLDTDPLVNADSIRVTTQNSVVTLEGIAPSDSQKEMAEMDTWYVYAVDKVINRLEVQHQG
jgi:osmotically-inducible protein OsmY